MAVTICKHPESDSLQEMMARGKRIMLGSLTLSTYVNAGISMSLTGITNLEAVFITNTNGRYYQYVHSTSLLTIYGIGTSTNVGEIASDTEAACFTAPLYFAIGRD
jgi:hypothetical protein